MSWELYKRIRDMHDTGDLDGALALITASGSELTDIRSHVACVEASCYEKKGDAKLAAQILEEQIKARTENFWVYYQIGELYRNLGRRDDALNAYRTAHALQGWRESGEKGYVFTHDFFSGNIPVWLHWFAKFIVSAPIRCLEIGSWQGMSAAWLLDKIVSQRQGLLTCIDTFEGSSEHQAWLPGLGHTLQDFFDHNINASGNAHLCRKLVGRSQDVLFDLSDQSYDFVYIDGAHEAKFVIQDAILSWRILRPGGFLIFDDVDFHFPLAPEQDTRKAIDAFTTWFADELEIVEINRQVLIRKLDGSERSDDRPDDHEAEGPGTGESLVLTLYNHLLGRAPSEEDLSNWTEAAARVSPAKLVERFVDTSEYKWRRGVDTEWPPGFYHSPVVDPTTVRSYVSERAHTKPADLLEIPIDVDAMWRLWDTNIDTLRLEPFSPEKVASKRFYLKGSLFPDGDAISCMAMLGHFRPKRIVEIGSGFSTACLLDCADFYRMPELKIICIEPYPSRLKELLHPGDYGRLSIIEAPVQSVPVDDIVTSLDSGDLLFIDSTHVLKTGSDVHYELFHILPVLKPGVIIHFHDCPYPFEYPDRWIFELNYSWNEAYALRALLMYNNSFKILFWGSMLQKLFPEKVAAEGGRFGRSQHSSLWVTKVK